jgi:hypothetical protein
MDLTGLIVAFDGCKRLSLPKAQKKLERLINAVAGKMLSDFRKENKGAEDEDETATPAETTQA